jgi:hypothetical protein
VHVPEASDAGSGRYEIRQSEHGPFIYCKEAPSVSVRVDRALAFSEADAQKLGERVILLDGVGQFAPTIDSRRQLYNLDHHADCLRSFTIASCEQALIVVVKGLPLDMGDWTIYANDPDLDTLLAIWLLLNFRRIPNLSRDARDTLLPLVRLEGAIDSNGAEIAEYCGLPSDAIEVARSNVEALFEKERQIKQSGNWAQLDPLDFTVEMLQELDAFIYGPGELGDFAEVEHDYGHVDIGSNWVAVVCRDGSGIYEVERRLRHVWSDRLGLIVLEREPGHYTIRRSASLSTIDLGDAYARLNLLDRAVDGHPPEKRWGGSDEIGGSPRPTGSALSPEEVKDALKSTYHPPGALERALDYWRVSARSALVVCAGAATAALSFAAVPRDLGALEPFLIPLSFSWGTILLSALFTQRLSRGRSWLFGWRRPATFDWWLPALLVPLTGAAGGTWTPPAPVDRELASIAWLIPTGLSVALATELWFRGWMHGLLLTHGPVQSLRGRWFLSSATLGSGVLYALFAAAFAAALAALGFPSWVSSPTDLALVPLVASALAAGWLLGLVRERSLSIWPCVIAQALAVAAGIGRVVVGLY